MGLCDITLSTALCALSKRSSRHFPAPPQADTQYVMIGCARAKYTVLRVEMSAELRRFLKTNINFLTLDTSELICTAHVIALSIRTPRYLMESIRLILVQLQSTFVTALHLCAVREKSDAGCDVSLGPKVTNAVL